MHKHRSDKPVCDMDEEMPHILPVVGLNSASIVYVAILFSGILERPGLHALAINMKDVWNLFSVIFVNF